MDFLCMSPSILNLEPSLKKEESNVNCPVGQLIDFYDSPDTSDKSKKGEDKDSDPSAENYNWCKTKNCLSFEEIEANINCELFEESENILIPSSPKEPSLGLDDDSDLLPNCLVYDFASETEKIIKALDEALVRSQSLGPTEEGVQERETRQALQVEHSDITPVKPVRRSVKRLSMTPMNETLTKLLEFQDDCSPIVHSHTPMKTCSPGENSPLKLSCDSVSGRNRPNQNSSSSGNPRKGMSQCNSSSITKSHAKPGAMTSTPKACVSKPKEIRKLFQRPNILSSKTALDDAIRSRKPVSTKPNRLEPLRALLPFKSLVKGGAKSSVDSREDKENVLSNKPRDSLTSHKRTSAMPLQKKASTLGRSNSLNVRTNEPPSKSASSDNKLRRNFGSITNFRTGST